MSIASVARSCRVWCSRVRWTVHHRLSVYWRRMRMMAPGWVHRHHQARSRSHRRWVAVRVLLVRITMAHDRRVGHCTWRRPDIGMSWIASVLLTIIAVVSLRRRTSHHASGSHVYWRRCLSKRIAQCRRRRAIAWPLEPGRINVWWPVLCHWRRRVA